MKIRGLLYRIAFPVLAGLCTVYPARALDPHKSLAQYIHREWDAESGFLGGQVHAIAQSGDGYLWVGTERGLVRFDGFRFTLFQRPISGAPPIGAVRELITDGEGSLWVRLDGPHLIRYANGQFEDVLASLNRPQDHITAMSLDTQKRLILTILGDQILRFRNGQLEAINSAKSLPGTILAIALARDGTAWVGTRDGGLYHIVGGNTTRIPGMVGATKINVLLPATNGAMWAGTDDGLFLVDRSGKFTTELPAALSHIEITGLTFDPEANVWAATSRGLYRITHTLQADLEVPPNSDSPALSTVCMDGDGDVWYGSEHGIYEIRGGVFTAWTTANGLPSNNNGPIYPDSSGRTWFAPLTGGLYWMRDGQIGQVTEAGLQRDVVYSISGANQEIWLGRQHGGITELTVDGKKLVSKSYTTANGLPQDAVYSVLRSSDGSVWAATASAGIIHIKDARVERISQTPMSDAPVNSIVQSGDGTIWFGGSAGLVRLTNGHWQTYTTADRLPSPYVQTLLDDSKQTLWIATSSGLAYLKSGVITVPEHLPYVLQENILGMAEDAEGDLWFSTSDHILRVNRDRLLNGTLSDTDIQSYGAADGLPGVEGISRDRTMVSDSYGRIWVSLNRGLAVADPNLGTAIVAPTSARIESVVVDGLTLPASELSSIAPNTHSIAFHFSSTNLLDPQRVRFRYKLDGADQNWSEIVDLQDVVYRNLGPGGYHFHIIASNAQGLWNGPDTVVSFAVDRAFWQTWWFRTSCLVLLALITVVLYQLRMIRLAAQLNAAADVGCSSQTLRFAELRSVRPMIETYPLEKAAEAYARMMSGNAEFRVVLTM